MRPVAVVEVLAVVDQVKVEDVDVWKNASDQADPEIFFDVKFFLPGVGEDVAGREVPDEHGGANNQRLCKFRL